MTLRAKRKRESIQKAKQTESEITTIIIELTTKNKKKARKKGYK